MLDSRFPLSLHNVEELPHGRGIEISHDTVRYWWNRFGPMFAAKIRRRRVDRIQACKHGLWHLNDVFVMMNGVTHYFWRAVDYEGEAPEDVVTKTRNRKAAPKLLWHSMKRHG